jgi:hypothetical protein
MRNAANPDSSLARSTSHVKRSRLKAARHTSPPHAQSAAMMPRDAARPQAGDEMMSTKTIARMTTRMTEFVQIVSARRLEIGGSL